MHVILPTLPFTLSGFIRLVITSWQLSGAFSASELSICVALLALFVNQSLVQHTELLENDDKRADIAAPAAGFLVLAIILLISFALIVTLESISNVYKLDTFGPTQSVDDFVYLFSVIVVGCAILVQRSYRLKARL